LIQQAPHLAHNTFLFGVGEVEILQDSIFLLFQFPSDLNFVDDALAFLDDRVFLLLSNLFSIHFFHSFVRLL